ncbi:hypothetical protein [Sphingomonas sp.]|uniref:hypothetical protein n=1 Tax=Sphingomonas sp. TaxID=28214 RepID=UPI00178DDA81|nr:hypothetical protein [Sphingomonas sp.]MBA3510396.1 hypothetical protein [Sphingomonas sp.]
MNRVRRIILFASSLFVAGCENDSRVIATNQMSNGNAAESSASAPGARAWTIPMQIAGTNEAVSCATAFSTEASENAVASWLTGYWSGLNVGRGLAVGSTTDSNGILREVKLDCQKTPSATLHHSAHQTYNRMRANKR